MRRKKAIISIITLILLTSLYFSYRKYKKNNIIIKKEPIVTRVDIPQYLSHPNKCYDCEVQMLEQCGESCVWSGQKTKSFDSERELVGRTGNPNMGYLAKTIKYY